jgi:hypothetical protein
MVKAITFFGRFRQWRGIAGKTKPNANNELCGTCQLRMECACFRKGLPVDYCEDYSGDPSTRICKVCKKLTILTTEEGATQYRCHHCGAIQMIPMANWRYMDIQERIRDMMRNY